MRTEAIKFRDCLSVYRRPRTINSGQPLAFEQAPYADYLSRTNKGVKQRRPQSNDTKSQNRPPRVADQNKLAQSQLIQNVFGHFDAVLCHLLQGHVGCRSPVLPERSTRATLIPLRSDVALL